MQWKVGAIVGMFCAATLTGGGVAQALNIDTFDCGDQLVNNGTPSNTLTGLACAVGESRRLALTPTGTVVGGVDTEPPGILSINPFSGAQSTLTVTWDADGEGLGGVDLLADGATGIQVNDIVVDTGILSITALITDTSDLTKVGTLAVLSGVNEGDQTILFTSFGGTGNLSTVKAITFSFVSTPDTDWSIDSIQTNASPVPEPGTLALLGTGLASLPLVAWKRRRQQRTARQDA